MIAPAFALSAHGASIWDCNVLLLNRKSRGDITKHDADAAFSLIERARVALLAQNYAACEAFKLSAAYILGLECDTRRPASVIRPQDDEMTVALTLTVTEPSPREAIVNFRGDMNKPSLRRLHEYTVSDSRLNIATYSLDGRLLR